MDVAIGLPNTVPGTKGDRMVEFARRGEAAGFSSLGTLDRLVYSGYEPLVSLAAVAAATDRIPLLPIRPATAGGSSSRHGAKRVEQADLLAGAVF